MSSVDGTDLFKRRWAVTTTRSGQFYPHFGQTIPYEFLLSVIITHRRVCLDDLQWIQGNFLVSQS